jgi:hypothetical protein
MGLDATVHCNCFEKGRLREPVPIPMVMVSPDGSLECASENLEELMAFDQWLLERACEHPNGILLHHRLGNLDRVGFMRQELQRESESFPVLLNAVFYSGTHAGDYLDLKQVREAQEELSRLERFICLDASNQELLDLFRCQMTELAEVALRIGKPITF